MDGELVATLAPALEPENEDLPVSESRHVVSTQSQAFLPNDCTIVSLTLYSEFAEDLVPSRASVRCMTTDFYVGSLCPFDGSAADDAHC